jgi:hypothetical protein
MILTAIIRHVTPTAPLFGGLHAHGASFVYHHVLKCYVMLGGITYEELYLNTFQKDIACTGCLSTMLEVPFVILILELSAPTIWARGGTVD